MRKCEKGTNAIDKLTQYRQYVQQILSEYGAYQPAYGQIEIEQIIDPVRDHYQLMTVGWDGLHRVHGCLIHIDIKNEKIWVQHDGTEEGIANRLVEVGVPHEDIVLAFHAPYKRQFTAFATG